VRAALRGLHVGLQLLVSLAFLFPVYWIMVTATNLPGNVYRIPPTLIPHFDLRPLVAAWTSFPWLRYLANSGAMTAFTILFVVMTSALAGYALAEGRFRGREATMLLLLAGAMVPEQALLVPRYLVVHSLHLLNTYLAEVLPLLFNSFGIFLFRQFFLTLPPAYRDAARIDGCGEFRYFWHVAFPLARGITYAVALLVAIATWNQFQWPLVVTSTRAIQPIEVVLAHFSQTYESDWRRMASAVLISVVPLIVLFLAARRQIMAAVVGDQDGGLTG
jgi:ABC-type glycerol-3-phosphate transport system permease component